MKKSVLFLASLIFIIMFKNLTVSAQDTMIPAGQLPVATKTFVQKNISSQAISCAKKENRFVNIYCKVRLESGTNNADL